MPEVKYNSDELVPPEFINEQFVVDLLKSVEKDPDLKLINHAIKPGSSAGDHYASIMFKIIATYETKGRTVSERRFILKTMPVSGEKKEMLEDVPIFDNEIKIYTQTLPAMEEILKKTGENPWWPTLVYWTKSPVVLVFDDLTQDSFGMIYEPLKMNQINVILEKIAKYHALSMVIADSEKRDLVTQYVASFQPDQMRMIFGVMIDHAKNLAISAQSWPKMEKIGAKVEKSIEKIFNNFTEVYADPPTRIFSVLNHGDFHIRNMMFKKDEEGSIAEVKFLDFQIPLYRSPGFDLVYMMNAIASKDVRDHKPEVIRKYHSYLVQSLEIYGFKGRVPTLFDVNMEVLHMSSFDAFQSLTFLPVFQMDLTGIELSELFNKDEENPMAVGLRKVYQDPEFIEEMSRVMTTMDNLGLYD